MKKRFALIGHPLGHSLSPEIHSAIMAAAGIDGTYELVDIAPEDLGERLEPLLRAVDGLNATIPHKRAVIPFLKSVSDAARRCNAVNTVFKGRGYNTDTAGFAAAKLPLDGAAVALVGTGGVASMMAAESIAAGAARLAVIPHSEKSGKDFIADLRRRFPDADCELSLALAESEKNAVVETATVLLNGSPVGMWPNAGTIPVNPAALHSGLSVFDPVYCPTPSRLVLNTRKVGGKATGGLAMLVHQAAAAQKIWNPDVEIDSKALVKTLLPSLQRDLWRKNATKIILTGFMGAGKSTVGRVLARSLGLPFVDLDEEIVKKAGVDIPSIFASKGEAGFRAIETETAAETLAHGGSEVVASGGGFPTIERNRALVRNSNALVIHIDGTFETHWARIARNAGSRPLGSERQATLARYTARKNIYLSFCDAIVESTPQSTPEQTAASIRNLLAP